MAERVPLRLTITGVYYANPDHYPTDDQTPEHMAQVDLASATEDPYSALEWLEDPQITVEPAGGAA